MHLVLRIFLFFILAYQSTVYAFSPYAVTADKTIQINVALFISSTCPHCMNADAFFRQMESTNSWLRVQRYVINEDKNALIQFNQLLGKEQSNDFSVPAVYFCNSHWIGFATAQTTGKDLQHALNYCQQQIEKNGQLTPATIAVLKRWANANKFNSGMLEQPPFAYYLLVVGLIDAFNPCAIFSFAAFFSLLFLARKKKEHLYSGCLFIFAVAIVHYWQQVYPNIFYTSLPWLRLPAILIGLYGFYMGWLYYKKKVEKGFYLFVFLYALIIQCYQQTCIMNWSYIFQQWLYIQPISNGQKQLLEIIYQVIYIIPLAVVLALYLVGITYFTRLERNSHSGLVILLLLSLCLIIYPWVLTKFYLSLLLIPILLISNWYFNNK